MSINFERVPSSPLGTPGSPSSIAASGASSGGVTIASASSSSTNAFASVSCGVTIGATAPSTPPTVQPWYSYNGTDQLNYPATYVVPITSVSTTYSYLFDTIPLSAVSAGFTITDGTGQAITAFVQGGVLSTP